jgi:hypothetical protein
MFEQIQSIPHNAKTIYAYKTLMMFTRKITVNAVAFELYLREVVKEKSYYNKMETAHELLELCRTHQLRFGDYSSEFPDRWLEPDWCELDDLRLIWVPKAKELVDALLPNMLETF